MIHEDLFGEEENKGIISPGYDNIPDKARYTVFCIIVENAYHFESDLVFTQKRREDDLDFLKQQIAKHQGSPDILNYNAQHAIHEKLMGCPVKDFLQIIQIFIDIRMFNDRTDGSENRLYTTIYEINETFRRYKIGYEIVDGRIQKISLPGFEKLVNESIETNDPKNIDSRIQYAISKYFSYDSSNEEKKEAIRNLADVLELLREEVKENGEYLPNEDDKTLRQIINNYDIRHLNSRQQRDYDKDVWYDWFFYTFLSSIRVILKLNEKKFNAKVKTQKRKK